MPRNIDKPMKRFAYENKGTDRQTVKMYPLPSFSKKIDTGHVKRAMEQLQTIENVRCDGRYGPQNTLSTAAMTPNPNKAKPTGTSRKTRSGKRQKRGGKSYNLPMSASEYRNRKLASHLETRRSLWYKWVQTGDNKYRDMLRSYAVELDYDFSDYDDEALEQALSQYLSVKIKDMKGWCTIEQLLGRSRERWKIDAIGILDARAEKGGILRNGFGGESVYKSK